MSSKRNSVVREVEWSESYELHGINQGEYTVFCDGVPIKSFTDFISIVKCNFCESEERCHGTSLAILRHFVHCSREHGYVFPEDSQELVIIPENRSLQDTITASQIYGLPFLGYEDHSKGCIRQVQFDREVCVLHKGAGIWQYRGNSAS